MTGEIQAAWAEIVRVLPDRAPALWRSLNGPAEDHDIAKLRRQVRPALLPGWLEAWLRHANGQCEDGRWPGWGMGPLLPVDLMIREHRSMQDAHHGAWPATWLPIMHAGWGLIGVELELGVVLDMSLDSPPRLVAPSFASLLTVAVDLVERGMVDGQGEDLDLAARNRA